MKQCCLCPTEHPNPKSSSDTLKGWKVVEADVEICGNRKKIQLIFCPQHTHEETWEKITKEFPPEDEVVKPNKKEIKRYISPTKGPLDAFA